MFSEKDFAQRLSILRENKGVSARDMSLSLGLNPSYINTIENGKALPTMSNFFSICDFLGIEPGEFFEADNKNPETINSIIYYLKKMNPHQIDLLNELVKELAD